MATIKEDYCSKEIYRLLIEKGFDGEIHTTFDKEGYTQPSITHQMAMKWLREVHNLFIELYVVKNYSKKKLEYTYSIQDLDFQGSDDGIECCKNWDTPEQACEIAIKYCLEKLI